MASGELQYLKPCGNLNTKLLQKTRATYTIVFNKINGKSKQKCLQKLSLKVLTSKRLEINFFEHFRLIQMIK